MVDGLTASPEDIYAQYESNPDQSYTKIQT
jgi:hypothetical protein